MTVSIFKSAINPSFKLVMSNGYKAITSIFYELFHGHYKYLYHLFNGHD